VRGPRVFPLIQDKSERLSVFVFAAKRRVKGAVTLTSFALGLTGLLKGF